MVEERNWGSRLFDVGNHMFLVLFGFACLFPMLHVLAVSFSDRAASVGGFVTVWPIRFTLANYDKIFHAGTIYQAAWISVQRTVLGTLINLLLTVLTAYPLSKAPEVFKGRSVFMWLVIFAMLFNGGVIPWFLVIRSLGLINKIWALILPGALPIWNVILTMNFFRDRPNVYSIQAGNPWWYKTSDQARTLRINTNGTYDDAFSGGNVPGMIWATFKHWIGLSSSEEHPGDILKFLRAPGHSYSWQYPHISSEIITFLEENFPNKN